MLNEKKQTHNPIKIMIDILFPIETIARELDYRILLAAKVLKKGRRVYICNHRYLDKKMNLFNGGVYVGKHIYPALPNSHKAIRYKNAKKRGINIIFLHEEGAVFGGQKDVWENILTSRYDPKGFDQADRICVWGEWQKSILQKTLPTAPLLTTGHPRFDLYKEEYREFYKNQTDKLKETYGDFILINSNYTGANYSANGIDYFFSPKIGYTPSSPELRQKFVDFYIKTTKSMVDMIGLIHRLSTTFPNKTLIFRSHPSESDLLYKRVFFGLKNVKVLHEGPIGPWLLAAETIIHDGCTSAIEASFCNAHIINYRTSEEEKKTDIRLPSLIGEKLSSVKQVIESIKKKTKTPINKDSLIELRSMIENYQSNSFDLLANIINDSINSDSKPNKNTTSNNKLRYEYTKYILKRNAKTMRIKLKGKTRAYQNKKFPGFNHQEVREKVINAEKITNKKIKITYTNPLMIVLECE